MLVLDADSVMSGAAIVRQVRIMEGHPEIGILQQLIVGLPNVGPFPRIFQFGMRHGMRAHTVGSAWWQGDCGPYWGHNALIRIAPFMAHCRLPELPGGPPLGGRLLSHDQVEAVLMRRAGWQVRVLPDEQGSFEENPPTLSDFVKRDLRWCQGNWQYLHLLRRPDLHSLGRLQLGLAILMYVSGPAWMLFSLVSFGRAMAPAMPATDPATPLLGMPMPWEPWALLAAVMTLVFAPKLAGVAQVLLTPSLRRDYGGGGRVALSALVEFVFSFILAPIMAVGQSIFLLGMIAGRTISWEAQRRDPRVLGWSEAWRAFWPQTTLGLALGISVWSFAPEFGAPLGRPALWPPAARGPVRGGDLVDPAGRLSRAHGRLRSTRGDRAAAGGGCHRACGRTPADAGRGRRGPPACIAAARGATGRLSIASAGLPKADIGRGRIIAAVDRLPAQPPVERQRPRVPGEALQLERPVGFCPCGLQQPAADAAATPGRRHVQEMHECVGSPQRQEPHDLSGRMRDQQFLATHLLGEVAGSPRRHPRLDLLLRNGEQPATGGEIVPERRAHLERCDRAHSPGASAGEG